VRAHFADADSVEIRIVVRSLLIGLQVAGTYEIFVGEDGERVGKDCQAGPWRLRLQTLYDRSTVKAAMCTILEAVFYKGFSGHGKPFSERNKALFSTIMPLAIIPAG
jgi:hypothetical protein